MTGGNKKSGLYEDGVRKDRLDNDDMITQLEARIRAKASIWTKRVVLTCSSEK